MDTIEDFFRQHWIKLILGLALAGSFLILPMYQWYMINNGSISTYNMQQDWPFVKEFFTRNWYWLVAESSNDFDVEHAFQNRASSKNPQDYDKVTIKTYREHNKPLGFIAYYKKRYNEGFVWFLAVDEAERNKGIASKLLDSALKDFKIQGVRWVWIITRTNNLSAQKVYKKAGFVQTSSDEKFVIFEKLL